MKKPIVLSLIAAAVLLYGSIVTPSHAQAPSTADAPTFYRLVPGTYVNGWPRFTIHYPKEWVELRPRPEHAFAAAPGPTHDPVFGFSLGASPDPLEKVVDLLMPLFKTMGTDVAVLSDRPSQLRDGTPARQFQIHWVQNGAPVDDIGLATKKGDTWIVLFMTSVGGRIGEDLKAFLYSVEFQPGYDEPVKVPPDVQAFLDENRNATVAHDMEKLMSFTSDRYLNSGRRKVESSGFGKPYIDRITSFQIVITDFIPAGDRAYLAGFVDIKPFGRAAYPHNGSGSIIKENGEWKWYGNQRDVAPE